MDLMAILKEGGFGAVAVVASLWAWTLWVRIRELEQIIMTMNSTCLACGRTHAERLLELGNGAVQAIERSTEAIAASQRQGEIMKRLGDMQISEATARRKSGMDR